MTNDFLYRAGDNSILIVAKFECLNLKNEMEKLEERYATTGGQQRVAAESQLSGKMLA